MLQRLSALAALPALALSTTALAAGPLEVVSQVMSEQRVTAPDGTTSIVLAPVDKVVPGDRVVFTLAYRNTGNQPIANLVLNNPVPQGIAYRGSTPEAAKLELSVDGQTFGALETLKVRTEAGERAATPDDVTYVRWRLANPVAPGANGQVSFQAVLR